MGSDTRCSGSLGSLKSATGDAFDALVEAVAPHARAWASDDNGAGVVCTLLHLSSGETRKTIVSSLAADAAQLVNTSSGSRVLKKAMRVCDDDEAAMLADVLGTIEFDEDAADERATVSALLDTFNAPDRRDTPASFQLYEGEPDASLFSAPPHLERMLGEAKFTTLQRKIINATWHVPQEWWQPKGDPLSVEVSGACPAPRF